MSIFSLEGKVAVVTGGFRGIGRALASSLKDFGADVVVADIEVDQRVKEQDGFLFIKCNVCEKEEVEEATALILEKYNHIDVLVNDAGVIRRSQAVDMPLADWEHVFSVNVTGAFLFSQAVGRQMIRQGKGKIINIASNYAESGVENCVAYCSSKGAIVSLTRTLAIEWAKYGINVNAVSPAVTRTSMTEKKFEDPKILKQFIDTIPMGRVLEPGDLAGAVVFLASNASDMVTGHNLHVDGGLFGKIDFAPTFSMFAKEFSMGNYNGGEVIVEYLIKEKVPYIFGLCGHGDIGLLDAVYDRTDKIKAITVRHEQAAGHMADAYFRVAHKPVATLTSCGPGTSNLPIALGSAFLDSSAFLAITGNVPLSQFNRGPLQESYRHFQGEGPQVLRPYVKKIFQPTRVEMVPLAIRQAFKTMLTGRPGPCVP